MVLQEMGVPEIGMEDICQKKGNIKLTLIVLVQVKKLIVFVQIKKMIERIEHWN